MLFKEEIKSKVDLEGFTREEQQEIIDKLEESILTRINRVLLEKLAVEDREDFRKLSEKPYTPAMPQFLGDKIPNVSQLITDTADEVLEEFNRQRQP
jgi:hypothetical protein